MNIFYYSVHHILEDDEIRLLQKDGHNVFCFGVNRKDGATQGFRPSLIFNATECQLFDIYAQAGGTFNESDDDHRIMPADFESHFSAFIFMHDINFISRFWHRLRQKPVVWRTIGQMMEPFEVLARPMRRDGLKIIRYSPKERDVPLYQGEDATIRFYKDPDQYGRWIGNNKSVLTFANDFQQRYPIEALAYLEIALAVPCALGGGGNADLPGSFGFVDLDHQLLRYRNHRAYLYISGLEIPYTLNFIEAWMTGIPVVVYAPEKRIGPYYEIDELIIDNENGYICRTVEEVKDRCYLLLNDWSTAARIGKAGRQSAIDYFGYRKIAEQWNKLLSTF